MINALHLMWIVPLIATFGYYGGWEGKQRGISNDL